MHIGTDSHGIVHTAEATTGSVNGSQVLEDCLHGAERAYVEQVFLVVKRLWRHAKVRYRGLEKNASCFFELFALVNLYRLRRKLLAQG